MTTPDNERSVHGLREFFRLTRQQFNEMVLVPATIFYLKVLNSNRFTTETLPRSDQIIGGLIVGGLIGGIVGGGVRLILNRHSHRHDVLPHFDPFVQGGEDWRVIKWAGAGTFVGSAAGAALSVTL